MKLNAKTLDMACIAGFLVFAVGGSVLALRSARAYAGRVAHRNRSVEERIVELKKAQAVLDRLELALRSNEAALAALRRRLPDSLGVGQFLSSLHAVMTRHDVELSKVTPGDTAAHDLYRKTAMSFRCRGAFADLHAVMYELETMERLVRIEGVSIGGGAAGRSCSMDVACSVYSR